MAKFQNNGDQHISFTILGEEYEVPPGSVIDVQPAHEPFVRSRGIRIELVRGERLAGQPSSAPPTKGVRKIA